PVFGEVLDAIERGKADALIAWDVSRIARNIEDGARIVSLMARGKLKCIVTSGGSFANQPNDVFLLNILFADGKRYVDSLSISIKRGLDSKVEKGIYPRFAPIGYCTDPKTKEIQPDPQTMPHIRQAFAMYA